MECYELREVLYRYMDGELRVWRRVQVRTHLENCPECEGEHTFQIEMRSCLQRACCEDVPEGLAERILRALRD